MLSSLLSPTRVLSFEELSPADFAKAAFYLGGAPRKAAVVVDGRAFPERDALVAGLQALCETVVLDRVRPDPLASDVDAMREMIGGGELGLVVGIGGGSVLDSAKALAMLAANGGSLGDYLGPAPSRKIERKGPPLLLVPTTAGTGSEATKVGVFTSDSGRKYTLGSPLLQADAAILSGSLAAGMPPALAASTGFDALSHALESLWNRNATPVTVQAAVDAAVAVLRGLEPAYDAAVAAAAGKPLPGAKAAALRMLEAASMAGFAFSRTGTAMVHALSFVLSEEWHVPHGAACAFTLEDAYRYALSEPENRARLARIGAALFPEAAAARSAAMGGASESAQDRDERLAGLLLERVLVLKRKMGLPERFADLGISVDRGAIPGLFARSFDDPKMANNFPAAERPAVYAILEAKA